MKAMGPIPPDFAADEEGGLLIGRWRATALAHEEGSTPLFAYDKTIIEERVRRFRRVMPGGMKLHYAIKANPFEPLVAFLKPLVDGFDVASEGETRRLPSDGPNDVSFAGPAKTDWEIESSIALGFTLNVESYAEAARAIELGRSMTIAPRLAVRVNPPFALKGAGMKMGGLASPFGVDHEQVPYLVRRIIDQGADWRGFHIFSGSQCLSAEALIETQAATVALAADLAEQVGAPPPQVNLGGGFGIPYAPGDHALDIEIVGESLRNTLKNRPEILRDTQFILELGRWLVGEAGVYLTRIVERKQSRGQTFLVTDGGLHHMLAASGNFGQLLRRNYPVAIADRFGADAEEEVTITGCLCTPLDLLADQVLLPRAEVGDLVAIFCAGAYGLSASPQAFLSQPPAGEMLV